MYLLGVDVGTTHCKTGLFDEHGADVAIASRPTITRRAPDGRPYYDPDELWTTVAAAIRKVTGRVDPTEIAAVGIASMAESGLLLERATGAPRSEMLPWHDPSALQHAIRLGQADDPVERFRRTGLHTSFKYGLAKLLWLRERCPDAFAASVWLSAADFIAYRLTGQIATDVSLAARTYAYRIDRLCWDDEWIRGWGFEPSLFPEVLPSGQPIGESSAKAGDETGLPPGTPVAIAGHDHPCAAVAVGAHRSGAVFDSIGTAESLLGTMTRLDLGEREYHSGLSFGCHVLGDQYFWLGGISAAGGSVEWQRGQLGDPPLSYDAFQQLLEQGGSSPTGILYFPYLAGSGAPRPDVTAQAAFVGLRAAHTRADLCRAVLEGTAYEVEAIRRAAELVTGESIQDIVAVGGGTRMPAWMQIKADVSGCRYDLPELDEAALKGAAIVAAVGRGLFSPDQALEKLANHTTTMVVPDQERHRTYRRLYDEGYLPLQEPLRHVYRSLAMAE